LIKRYNHSVEWIRGACQVARGY